MVLILKRFDVWKIIFIKTWLADLAPSKFGNMLDVKKAPIS